MAEMDMEDGTYTDPATIDYGSHYNGDQGPPGPSHHSQGQNAPITKRQITIATHYSGSIWIWGAIGTLLFSAVFHIIAFSTNGWVEVKSTSVAGVRVTRDVGLWQECHSLYGCSYLGISDFSDAVRAVQAFAVLSFLGIFTAVLLTSMYVLVINTNKDPRIALYALICRALTAFLLLLTVSIYGARWSDKRYDSPGYSGTLSYSFAFEILCMFSEIGGTVLMVLELFVFNRPGMDE